ncbi:MAG: transglycosylase SLT domain-containing protein [Gallionella sp.]|nr:transglycosylase SLT domain-containing protein [Gallionella sp.]
MPLIKLIFPILLAILGSTVSVHADEQPALSTSLANTTNPLTLTSARNIKLTLIPEDELNNMDLWQRLRGGFAMQELDSPLIAKHEQWYASRPEYIARMMDRGSRYLYYITSEVERRGMPSEIALLPMIESAFNPGAYSTSNASGLWQFIPSTGKVFGLQQNWWYDGRRDITSATTGALDYLEKLHAMFGDWELALAAYNWGEGAVSRAQERNRKKGLAVNYSSLTLPDETRNYLPKLLAIKNIVANPERFGLVLPTISNEPYFAAVSFAKHIDVKLAAQLADISREEFIALNPAHNRPVILQDNSDFILLPIDKIETYQTNLENYDKPLVSWQAYHAKKGERLDQLAPRFGLSVERLKKVNSLSARTRTSSGETLLVPLNGDPDEGEDEFEAFNMHLHPVSKTGNYATTIKHTVRKGETLAKLARRYNVSVSKLSSWNGRTRHIKAGQTLTIVQEKARSASRKSTRRLAKSGTRKIAQRKTTQRKITAAKNRKIDLAYQKK